MPEVVLLLLKIWREKSRGRMDAVSTMRIERKKNASELEARESRIVVFIVLPGIWHVGSS